MAKKQIPIPKDNNIIDIPLEEAMPENYLPYAVEVAKERALPDVRDGLKPVHRRILYGAYMLKAFPDRPYYKSARIVGDILGKFHPHGDTSVYDATVILAQNFSTREPLIDGHGNFGSIDGDSAAAMRYTEARLSNIAIEMLRDIDKDTVEMVPNYSDSELEPKVLPSRYPNLLVNGSFGIAVGLATNIPPHNLGEVTDGVLAYIDNPDIKVKDLMKYIKGPDLPTGGILIGANSLLSAYETGEGRVTYRAKTSIEKLENGRLGIVITEFPYRRNKAKILQTISEMTGDKRHQKALESVSDIRDESDRTGIRAVIEFKKSIEEDTAEKVLKYLFKKTDLQCNISFNMVALADGKPETMGLKTIIRHYVNHQKDVITRRTRKELEIAENRFHIVEGFIKAISILDQIIKTIRSSTSKKDACKNLVSKFGFTEIQANAILELMLYRLTGLEITTFKKEYDELFKKINSLKKILSEEKQLLKVIKKELSEIKDKFKSKRRTQIIEDESIAKIDIQELIVVEDVMITLSKDGFIKRIPEKNYNRSSTNPEDIEYREGDSLKFLLSGNTRDNLLLFTDKGNMYKCKEIDIPECKWKEKGERIDTIVKTLNLDGESIISVVSIDVFNPQKYLQFITKSGLIKISSLDKFNTNYTKLLATKLKDNDKVIDVKFFDESKDFIKVRTSKSLEFEAEMPKLSDMPRNVLGFELCSIGDKDSIKEAEYTDKLEYVSFNVSASHSKGCNTLKCVSKINTKNNMTVSTDSGSDLLLFTDKGKVLKIQSLILKEVIKKGVILEDLFTGFEPKEKIVSVYSIKQYSDNYFVFIFTKDGYVKKMSLKDFEGTSMMSQCHKFKKDTDEVVNVKIANGISSQIMMVTKKGMAIKFAAININQMSKIAAGVTGISLKEGDEVIFSDVLNTSMEIIDDLNEIAVTVYRSNLKYKITSKNKKTKEIIASEIKMQNRAGRGSGIMFIGFDDEITKVERN